MSGNLQSKSKDNFAIPTGMLPDRLASLLRVPIDYILEVWHKGKLVQTISLPNSPSSIDITRVSPTLIQHTLGKLPIRYGVGNRLRNISISGNSGLNPRQGYDRSGSQKMATGPEIFLEFDGFLQDYSELLELYNYTSKANVGNYSSAGPGSRIRHIDDQPYMVFRALKEKVHLRVEPSSWSWRRDQASSRFTYDWRCDLTGYAFAPQGGPKSLFSPLDEYMQTVGNALNTVATLLGIADNITNNLRSDIKGLVMPVLAAARNIAFASQNLQEGVADLANLPRSIVSQFAEATGKLKNAWESFDEISNPFGEDFDAEIERVRVIFGGTVAESEVAVRALGVVGGGPDGTTSSEMALSVSDTPIDGTSVAEGNRGRPSVQPRTLIMHVVRQGDTLQSLAEEHLGDADSWPEIARQNGMDGLRGENGRLVPGTRLIIPTERVFIGRNPGVLGAQRVEDMLGVDLKIDFSTGDLVASGDGDIALNRGPSNLEQGIALRLLTKQGALPLFPSYGLPLSPGIGMTSRIATYCSVHCSDQVLSDPRVMEVQSIEVIDGGDTLDVSMQIKAIDGGNLDLVAPVQREG